MNKFTPGPWKCVGTLVYFSNNAGGIDLRACPDSEANARLIAAAPDLLEALEAIIASECRQPDVGCAWTKARAAIARARGEE